MVRFLHTADWQLGMSPHFLGPDTQARFDAARLDAIVTIGRVAINESCEFIVVCGDVFDSNQPSQRVLLQAFEKLASTPQVTFFLLPGNHDPLDSHSIYRSERFTKNQPDNVKVLFGPEPVQATTGVELVPAPPRNKHPTHDLVDAACEGLDPTAAVRIVVGHGQVDSRSPDPNDPDTSASSRPALISLDRMKARIESGLIHYVALGDHHSTKQVDTAGRVWYSGAPEPTRFVESDPGNVLVVDLDEADVDVTVRPVGVLRLRHAPAGRRSSKSRSRGPGPPPTGTGPVRDKMLGVVMTRASAVHSISKSTCASSLVFSLARFGSDTASRHPPVGHSPNSLTAAT